MMAQYRIRVLEIGYDANFPAGVAFDFDYLQGETTYSPFSMTLLQGEGHQILFDCGFDPDAPFAADKIWLEGDLGCRNTKEVLLSVGVQPEEIDAVILSHCHWDHIGGMKYLPNATFYIQAEEPDCWERLLADTDFPRSYHGVVDNRDLETLRSYAREGRVVFLTGDAEEIFPGVTLLAVPGHSFSQSVLLVQTGGQRFAIIGDVAMRPESFTGAGGPGFLPNMKFAVAPVGDIVRSYRRILDWVGDPNHIITSHDGTRRKRWPTVKSDLGLDVSTICE